MHKTLLAAIAVSASLALASAALGSSSASTLNGTVGPGFTISLKMGGKTVKSLKAGTYTFKIADKANIHDFALKGPVSKTLTGVSFTGNKTVKIKLKKGKYTYYCQPHASTMHGSFTVK
jgi:plastocyanin